MSLRRQCHQSVFRKHGSIAGTETFNVRSSLINKKLTLALYRQTHISCYWQLFEKTVTSIRSRPPSGGSGSESSHFSLSAPTLASAPAPATAVQIYVNKIQKDQ